MNAAAEHLRAVVQGVKNDLRWKPIKPTTTDDIEEWFVYLHECDEAKTPYTLKQLADDVHLDYGYVRQLHSRYMAEHKN